MKTKTVLVIAIILFANHLSGATFEPFRDPAKCIQIPIKLGLRTTTGQNPTWANLGMGWSSMSEVKTHTGKFSRVGDVDNSITCLFNSGDKEFIQWVRVTADCFNQEGEHATLAKFREVVTEMLKEFGIADAIATINSIPPEQDTKIDGNTYTVEFKREEYKIGYGWTFTLTTK